MTKRALAAPSLSTAGVRATAESTRQALLVQLGDVVRSARHEAHLSRKELAARAAVSERFLAQLEAGEGNISVLRLEDVGRALGVRGADLLSRASNASPRAVGVTALLGLRGAGKTSIGEAAARRLGVPFVELDALVVSEAGMSLATIFEIHGEAHFRRIEREALRKFLKTAPSAVLATSGSIVEDKETFELLRAHTRTVWLKARPKDHWERVVSQGDGRPMRGRANARSELEELLRARKPLYERASAVVDTSALAFEAAVEAVVETASHRS